MTLSDSNPKKRREIHGERFQTILRYHEDFGYNHSPFAHQAVYDLICMVQRQDALVEQLRQELA